MARAVALFFALLIIGAGCIIYGVYLLAGFGWSLIAFGCAVLALAGLLRTGLTRNG